MNYICQTVVKTTLLVLVPLFTLVPAYTFAQVSDIAPAEVAAENSCIDFTSNFGYRSSDSSTSGSVSLLQDFLISRGYLNSESTGYFGGMTLKAVKAYQLTKGFGSTGYVGNYTRAAIKKDTCDNSVQPITTSPVMHETVRAVYDGGGVVFKGSAPASPVSAPLVDQFTLNKSAISLNESATLTYTFSVLGPRTKQSYAFSVLASKINKSMECNILIYNNATGETQSTLTSGSFNGRQILAGKDYPSGATISAECSNSAGKASKTLSLIVTGGYTAVSNSNQLTPFATLTINGSGVANGSSITLPSNSAAFTWGSTNASTCLFNGENIGIAGSKTLSGLTSSSHNYVCTNSTGIQSTPLKFSIVVPQIKTSPSVDVFLIAGQSNAISVSTGPQSASPVSSGISRYYAGKFGALDNVGAWPAFTSVYKNKTGRDVVLVATAVGGASQTSAANRGNGTWDVSGSLFASSVGDLDTAMKALSSAGYSPTFKGILWGQGESDAIGINEGKMTRSDYKNALVSMISRYRNHYKTSLPFYVFQTGTAVNEPDNGYAAVRSVQKEVPMTDPLTRIVFDNAVSFVARDLMWDTYHYKQAAYDEMGSVGAGNVLSAVSVAPNPNTPSVSFTINGSNVADGTSVTLPSNSAAVTWGSTNASTCLFNGENIGTAGSKILSGLTSSSHKYVCTDSTGQKSALSFSITVPSVSVTSEGISAPIINDFSLDKAVLPSNESATLSYYFWAPGLNSEKAMACTILTYNKATGQTQSGNTIVANTPETAGSFYGKRVYAGKDYPSGAIISVGCSNPAGSVSRSVDLQVVAPVAPVVAPKDLAIFINGASVTSLTVTEGDTIALSWSANNMGSDPRYYLYVNYVHKKSYAVTSSSVTTNDLGLGAGTHTIYLAACNGFTCSQTNSATITLTVNPRAAAPQPATTWINASAQCAPWVGITSVLITSGPNPIPLNYTVGAISYQYDSSNINNLRNLNTSSCSAPVSAAPSNSVTVTFSPNSVVKNVTPLTISYSANFATAECKVYLDGAYLTSILGSGYSWAVGPQDRPRTVMVSCIAPGGVEVSSGTQTFTVI